MTCPHCSRATSTRQDRRYTLLIVCPSCGPVGWKDDPRGIMSAALEICDRNAAAARVLAHDGEFWRRLAGSVRKALAVHM